MGVDADNGFAIDDDLWYLVTVDNHAAGPTPDDCSGPIENTITCCAPGWFITLWYENGITCRQGGDFCRIGGFHASRITNIEGPFDDDDCE